MVRLEDLFRRFPRTPMSVEVKERNEELIHKVVVQAGLGAGPGLDGGLTPPPLPILLPDSRPGEAL